MSVFVTIVRLKDKVFNQANKANHGTQQIQGGTKLMPLYMCFKFCQWHQMSLCFDFYVMIKQGINGQLTMERNTPEDPPMLKQSDVRPHLQKLKHIHISFAPPITLKFTKATYKARVQDIISLADTTWSAEALLLSPLLDAAPACLRECRQQSQ